MTVRSALHISGGGGGSAFTERVAGRTEDWGARPQSKKVVGMAREEEGGGVGQVGEEAGKGKGLSWGRDPN